MCFVKHPLAGQHSRLASTAAQSLPYTIVLLVVLWQAFCSRTQNEPGVKGNEFDNGKRGYLD